MKTYSMNMREHQREEREVQGQFFGANTDFSFFSDILVENNYGNSKSTLFVKTFFWMAREVLPCDMFFGLKLVLVLRFFSL
jgi:hypothetical protein